MFWLTRELWDLGNRSGLSKDILDTACNQHHSTSVMLLARCSFVRLAMTGSSRGRRKAAPEIVVEDELSSSTGPQDRQSSLRTSSASMSAKRFPMQACVPTEKGNPRPGLRSGSN